MPNLAELLLALLGPDPLMRQERRMIARHLCRPLREQQYLKLGIDLAEGDEW